VRGCLEQRRNILIGPGESPVGEQAQGEKFEELNKTDKANAVFLTRDIPMEVGFNLALIGGISSDTRLSDKLFIET
jgi:hypothetical protein